MYHKTDLLSPLRSLLRFKDSWFLLLSLPLIWKGQSSGRLERHIGSTQEGLGLPVSLPVDPNRGSFQGSSWQFHTRNTKLRKFTRWHIHRAKITSHFLLPVPFVSSLADVHGQNQQFSMGKQNPINKWRLPGFLQGETFAWSF